MHKKKPQAWPCMEEYTTTLLMTRSKVGFGLGWYARQLFIFFIFYIYFKTKISLRWHEKKKHCEKMKKPLNTNFFFFFFALKGILVVSLWFLFFVTFLYLVKYQILSSANMIIKKKLIVKIWKCPLILVLIIFFAFNGILVISLYFLLFYIFYDISNCSSTDLMIKKKAL